MIVLTSPQSDDAHKRWNGFFNFAKPFAAPNARNRPPSSHHLLLQPREASTRDSSHTTAHSFHHHSLETKQTIPPPSPNSHYPHPRRRRQTRICSPRWLQSESPTHTDLETRAQRGLRGPATWRDEYSESEFQTAWRAVWLREDEKWGHWSISIYFPHWYAVPKARRGVWD